MVKRADGTDRYDLQVRLRHKGEHALELPALDLTLTDLQG